MNDCISRRRDLPSVQPESSDCINRKAAIEAINHICPVDTEFDCALLDRVDVRYVLSDLPSVQQQRWIPVSEALPDRGKTVLITNDKGNVRSGRFRGVEFWKDDGVAYWTFKGNTVEHVLAWMPLPEPWEGQDE